jgi:hypothetical protein
MRAAQVPEKHAITARLEPRDDRRVARRDRVGESEEIIVGRVPANGWMWQGRVGVQGGEAGEVADEAFSLIE